MYEEKKKMADEFFKKVPKKYPEDKKLSEVSMYETLDEITIYDFEDRRRHVSIYFGSLEMNVYYEKDRNIMYKYSFSHDIGIDSFMYIVEEMASSAGLFLDDLDKEKIKEFASKYVEFASANDNKAVMTDVFIKEGISKLPRTTVISPIVFKG